MVVEWLLEVEKDGWRVVVGGCLRRFLEVVEWLLEVLEGWIVGDCWMLDGSWRLLKKGSRRRMTQSIHQYSDPCPSYLLMLLLLLLLMLLLLLKWLFHLTLNSLLLKPSA
jgi:hypothetical protein